MFISCGSKRLGVILTLEISCDLFGATFWLRHRLTWLGGESSSQCFDDDSKEFTVFYQQFSLSLFGKRLRPKVSIARMKRR